MAIGINKLYIQNFKVFDSFTLDFTNSNFVVFDGPNGFGKTSVYDAVELLITGVIRRYKSLEDDVVDKRNTFDENPYLNTRSGLGNIIIKAEIKVNESIVTIARKAERSRIENTASFDQFELFELENFDSDEADFRKADSEIQFLTTLFGKDYKENFEFLHYIEQEENAYLLRNTDTEKKKIISHLFNVEEFEAKISKLEFVKKKLVELCTTTIDKEINAEGEKLEKTKLEENPEADIPYEQIFTSNEYFWDKDKIVFSENSYSELLGEDGILTQLRTMIEFKEDLINYRYNTNLKAITKQEKEIQDICRYSFFKEKKDELKSKNVLDKSISDFITKIDNITLKSIEENYLNIPQIIEAVIEDLKFKKLYNESLKSIQDAIGLSNELSKIVIDLQSTRKQLVAKNNGLIEAHEVHESSEECPLCGFDWTDSSIIDKYKFKSLSENIEEQSNKIQKIIDETSADLLNNFEEFTEIHANNLKSVLNEYQKANIIDSGFVDYLLKLDFNIYDNLISKISALNIDIAEFFNSTPSMTTLIKSEELIAQITAKLKEYNNDNIKQYFSDKFVYFFSGNNEKVFEDLTITKIDDKITYIKSQFNNLQFTTYVSKLELYRKRKKDFEKAKSLTKEIGDIVKVYNDTLKVYNASLIRDIEILFHIYSGRIVQNFQGGLGLFIASDKGIKFLTNPSRSYDAVFSMSSGQISALIISFTLALNKKYSSNKLLFIDDPVQTMDELNIAGFIEVLRNDFSDRQIFISTHEDTMSTYMRYKFEKFGIATKRINMKELALLN